MMEKRAGGMMPDFDVRFVTCCSSQGARLACLKHTSELLNRTGCPTSPVPLDKQRHFIFFCLHHMCKFYHNG